MESQQRFRSLQNTSGGSQPNYAARFSLTTEKKRPDIPIYFEKEVIYTFNAWLSLCTGYRQGARFQVSSYSEDFVF